MLYPYFQPDQPLRWEGFGTYTDRSVKLKHDVTFEWSHPTSEVLTALIDAGLRIEFFHEFPITCHEQLPIMEPIDDKMSRLTKHDGSVPLMYSIKATKAE